MGILRPSDLSLLILPPSPPLGSCHRAPRRASRGAWRALLPRGSKSCVTWPTFAAMSSDYGKTVGGKLKLKGGLSLRCVGARCLRPNSQPWLRRRPPESHLPTPPRPRATHPPHHPPRSAAPRAAGVKRPREEGPAPPAAAGSAAAAPSSATSAAAPAPAPAQRVQGKGRFTSSGTTLHGVDSDFLADMAVGDAVQVVRAARVGGPPRARPKGRDMTAQSASLFSDAAAGRLRVPHTQVCARSTRHDGSAP